MEAETVSRTLLILRHGQAGAAAQDVARALTERGKRDVRRIAEWIRQQGMEPEVIIASAAMRTRATAALCCAVLGVDESRMRCEQALYLADRARWLAEINQISPEVRTAMVVGHNPDLSGLASRLGGEPIGLATANLVYLTTTGDWATQCDHTMQLQQVVDPLALQKR
ncbi:MAG: histidine phosphatase family protein [Mariprofundales bacterium]|nr:histidine phosphatase family protein [Mariprofundales bacterium]